MKKLYGQRDASRGFIDFMMGVLVDTMGFVQCPDHPCFYSDSVDLELHQDDIYATPPDGASREFATDICRHITLL